MSLRGTATDLVAATLPGSRASWLRPLRWALPMSMVADAETGDGFGLPIGTVTFLLTDVEGSTLAWSAAPSLMGPAIARHYEILDTAVAAHGGVRPQEQGEGDSIVAAFSRASDALRAALDAQRALADETWLDGLAPLKVRMAVHAGEAQLRNDANYVGQTIIRTARLRAIAHGSQIVVSQAARDLTVDQLGDEIELIDLGTHRLKDLARPEHVWQVVVPGLPRDHPPLKSLDTVPNNLPIALSTFVGRLDEIDAVTALCGSNRLVTITGSGGAGKTRLAQQVAAGLADQYRDGTWWIDLAPHEPSAVGRVVADVVSVKDPDQLASRLADSTMLLVFDNCEHVLDTVAPLVHALTQTCPGVQILATSRGALDIPGEVTWRLPPLQLPDTTDKPSLETLIQYDAVRLFIDRARRARPNFTLTNDNAPAVAEICARLDGLPLAIELAAARAKSLTAEQILTGLEHSLRLLTGGSRLVMARQQTNDASIAWSHDLLDETERVLLRRISVFAGGFDLEAAETICADDTTIDQMQILDSLEHLIDQSLVHVDDHGPTTRYRILETVRQYGAAQLAAADEHDQLHQQHANHYLALAHQWAPRCESADEEQAVAVLTPEHANIEAALRYVEQRLSVAELIDLIVPLAPMWAFCGLGLDGLAWFTTTLDRIPPEDVRSRARLLLARLEVRMTLGQSGRTYRESIEILEVVESHQIDLPVGRARIPRGWVAVVTDPVNGLALMRPAFAELEAAGDRYGLAWAKVNVSGMLTINGDRRVAQPAYDEARAVVTEVGSPRLICNLVMWEFSMGSVTGNHAELRFALETVERLMPKWPGLGQIRAQGAVQFADDLGTRMPTEEELDDLKRHYIRTGEDSNANAVDGVAVARMHLHGEYQRAVELADVASTAGETWAPAMFGRLGALAACALGDYDGAEARLQRSGIARSPSRPNDFIPVTQIDCLIALHRGQLAEAETAARSALDVCVKQGHRRNAIIGFQQLATIAARHGSWTETARLAGVAAMLGRQWTLSRRTEPFNQLLDEAVAAARAAIGDAAFDAAFAEGERLTLDEAVEFVNRAHGDRGRPTIGWTALTPTERRVADLVRSGLTNAAVAKELLMSPETVKTHLGRVFAKLGVNNRTKLAALAPPFT